MPRWVPDDKVEVVMGGLVGACAVDGGLAPSQTAVLEALALHLWHRPDLRPAAVAPLGAAELAALLPAPDDRSRFHELLFTVEMCRHPLTATQVARVDEYVDALGVEGPDVVMFRDLIREGAARAAADFDRFFAEMIPARSEPSLKWMTERAPVHDPELVERLERLHDLPEGSLGWSLIEFYRQRGLALPGSQGSALDPLYVAHDFIHIISGIAPTGEGEIALGGFQVAMADTPANSFAFLSPLIVHEAGFSGVDKISATAGTLGRPYAAELLAAEIERGQATVDDFSFIDHFELAPLPLAEVRERFGVQRPLHPDDGHHVLW